MAAELMVALPKLIFRLGGLSLGPTFRPDPARFTPVNSREHWQSEPANNALSLGNGDDGDLLILVGRDITRFASLHPLISGQLTNWRTIHRRWQASQKLHH